MPETSPVRNGKSRPRTQKKSQLAMHQNQSHQRRTHQIAAQHLRDFRERFASPRCARRAAKSCMVACQTCRFAASMKNNRKGTNVAARTNSYSELEPADQRIAHGMGSLTATISRPASRPAQFPRRALRATPCAFRRQSRRTARARDTWASRTELIDAIDQRTSHYSQKREGQQHYDQRAERARNAPPSN